MNKSRFGRPGADGAAFSVFSRRMYGRLPDGYDDRYCAITGGPLEKHIHIDESG